MYPALLLVKGVEASQLTHLTHEAMDVGALLPQLALAGHQVSGTQLSIRGAASRGDCVLVACPGHLCIGHFIVCRGQGQVVNTLDGCVE